MITARTSKKAGPHNCSPTSPNFSYYPRCSARPTMVPLARAYLLAASSVPPAEMAVNFLYRGPLPGPATEKHENQLENATTKDQMRTSSSNRCYCNGQDFTAPCLACGCTRYAYWVRAHLASPSPPPLPNRSQILGHSFRPLFPLSCWRAV